MSTVEKTYPQKEIYVIVSDGKHAKYTVFIPKQNISMHRIRKAIETIQDLDEFKKGIMYHEDVINYFDLQGIVAKMKPSFKVMYLNAKEKKIKAATRSKALDFLESVVKEYYSIADLKTVPDGAKARSRRFMVCKEIFCYLAKTKIKNIGYGEVADRLAYKTHVTAMHHFKKVEGWLDQGDQMVSEDLDAIESLMASKMIGQEESVTNDIQN